MLVSLIHLDFKLVVSLLIQGQKTVIVISSYYDHFLVVAIQIGSMRTILLARKEEGVSVDPTFNVTIIFRKRDEPMLAACARQLIEHISSSASSKSLVLSFGLRNHSMGTLPGIVFAVIEKLPKNLSSSNLDSSFNSNIFACLFSDFFPASKTFEYEGDPGMWTDWGWGKKNGAKGDDLIREEQKDKYK